MRMLFGESRPARMLATHAHALALPRMQRAQRGCSAKEVGGPGWVGRESLPCASNRGKQVAGSELQANEG